MAMASADLFNLLPWRCLRGTQRQLLYEHQLGHIQICTLPQTTTLLSHHSVFCSPDAFLLPNQQCKSTEGFRYSH